MNRRLPNFLRSCSPWFRVITAIGLFLASIAFLTRATDSVVPVWQPLACGILSILLVAVLFLDWKLFGDPSRPINLAGMVFAGINLFFLLNILYAENPRTDGWVGTVRDTMEGAITTIAPAIKPLADLVSAPTLAMLFLGICLALALPRRSWSMGWMGLLGVVALVWGSLSPAITSDGYFWSGVTAFLLGMSILRRNHPKVVFWTNVRETLQGDRQARGDLEMKTRLLKRLRDGVRPLESRDCEGVVARGLKLDSDDPEVRPLMLRVVNQMVHQDRLARIVSTPRGYALALNPELLLREEDRARDVATQGVEIVGNAVRLGIVVGFALLWILSPVDLIPDSIPVVGPIDDALVAVLATLSQVRGRSPRPLSGEVGDPPFNDGDS